MITKDPGRGIVTQPTRGNPNAIRLAALCLAALLAIEGCGGGKGSSSSAGGAQSIAENCDAAGSADAGTDESAIEANTGPSRRAAETCSDADSADNTDGATPGGNINPAPPGTAVVGPNLNGRWAGYFKSIEGFFEPLSATIRHVGASVTIRTTKKSGVARNLSGRIDGVGRLLLYDTFDKQDWTTLYGPASGGSINLADFVFVDTSLVDTNILILKRVGAGTVNRLTLARQGQQ